MNPYFLEIGLEITHYLNKTRKKNFQQEVEIFKKKQLLVTFK